MSVTKVTAAIRMSRQTDAGTWATVELGAEEEGIVELDDTWQQVQADLYQELRRQLKSLWTEQNGRPAAPATPQPAANGTAATPPVDTDTGEILECPEHHRATTSRYGGLYCPVRLDDETFCTWKAGQPKKAKKGGQ